MPACWTFWLKSGFGGRIVKTHVLTMLPSKQPADWIEIGQSKFCDWEKEAIIRFHQCC